MKRFGGGPVIATAIHAGHDLRPELAELSTLDEQSRLREEDPLTDLLAGVGDSVFISQVSRFEVDLNRSADQAVYRGPEDAWGLDLWRTPLSDSTVQRSLSAHAEFYQLMSEWIEMSLEHHPRLLLLDVHSYNHRRDGADGSVAPQVDNPDIDLGITTADPARFSAVVDTFRQALGQVPAQGRKLDIRDNVRFVDGGNFPEWVSADYGDRVCTITLEYKKFFMDEWTGQAGILMLNDLRRGLAHATEAARDVIV